MNTARRAVYIPDDHCEGLAKIISKLKGESLEDGEFYKSVIKLYPAHLEEYALKCIEECKCLFKLPENEIVPIFMLIFGVLRRSQAPVLQKVAETIINIFKEDTTKMAHIKIMILSNFYNLMPRNSPVRINLFMAILKLVADNDELASITTYLESIDNNLDSCGADIEQRRSIYLNISDVLCKDSNYIRESYEFKLKYLLTFENVSDEALLLVTFPHSEIAIRTAICTLGIFTFDTIQNLNAIKALFEKFPIYKELLNLFITGNLKEYQIFCQTKNNFLIEKNFNLDIALEKMRLLALCKTLEHNLNLRVSFQTLALAADVPLEKIEIWIIRLVQENIATVTIDQVAQTVIASRCLFTQFEEPQWRLVRDKLASWEETTKQILEVLRNSKQVSETVRPQRPSRI